MMWILPLYEEATRKVSFIKYFRTMSCCAISYRDFAGLPPLYLIFYARVNLQLTVLIRNVLLLSIEHDLPPSGL